MPGQVFERWRLILKVAPLVAVVALIKFGLDALGWEPVPLSPLYTGLIAATVFLLGFLLAGTLADYKESEKLPGELAARMETIADECLILYRDKQARAALDCLGHIRGLAAALLGWFHRREAISGVLERVSGLNHYYLAFEPLTQPNFIVRLKQEQSAIRRMLIRIDTIRETSFVGAGYAIAELATLLCLHDLLDQGPRRPLRVRTRWLPGRRRGGLAEADRAPRRASWKGGPGRRGLSGAGGAGGGAAGEAADLEPPATPASLFSQDRFGALSSDVLTENAGGVVKPRE